MVSLGRMSGRMDMALLQRAKGSLVVISSSVIMIHVPTTWLITWLQVDC